jgi:hypothetical protein
MAMSQVHAISAPVSIKSNYRTEKKKLEVIKTDSLLLPSPTSSVGFLQRKQIQLNDFKSFYER